MKYDFPSRDIDIPSLKRKCSSPDACEHPEKEIRRKADKHGKPMFFYQCLSCGCAAGRRIKKEDVHAPDSVEEFDPDCEKNAWNNYHQRFEKRRLEETALIERKWWESYNVYINSPEWGRLRQLVFRRADGVCEGCLSAKATDCHHTTYDNIGQEFLFELLALCNECHTRYHARIYPEFLKQLRSEILIESGRLRDDEADL
tara:strand:- start:159 stop:761 length:603 start_codon:yes stop_codon:yes gene_type:complete